MQRLPNHITLKRMHSLHHGSSHICQNYAKLPDQFFSFCDKTLKEQQTSLQWLWEG